MLILRGSMSTFGGPDDHGVAPNEGLALIEPDMLADFSEYFLPEQPRGTTGLARRLNPDSFYIACRWDYHVTPQPFLRASLVTVRNPANCAEVQAKPVDWGPNEDTGRVADLSPGCADALGLETDDACEVSVPTP